MGSTGYQPVPVGNLPTGREGTRCGPKPPLTQAASPPFRPASGPAARAGSPCYPLRYEISGLKPRVARNELPWVRDGKLFNPNGVVAARGLPCATPLGL